MKLQHGHGNLTNLIGLRRVWMTVHSEGVGTDESPLREVKTFFDEDGRYITRYDIANGTRDNTSSGTKQNDSSD